jgi:hypothetical protein
MIRPMGAPAAVLAGLAVMLLFGVAVVGVAAPLPASNDRTTDQ